MIERVEDTPTADVDGWIEWTGGENPAGDQQTDYRLRNGRQYFDRWAGGLEWDHGDNDGDIIAYRVVSSPTAAPASAVDGAVERLTKFADEGDGWTTQVQDLRTLLTDHARLSTQAGETGA